MKANQEKRKMWASTIKKYRASGLTAATWCQQNNVNINNLKSWIKKFNKETLTAESESKSKTSTNWVALKPPEPASTITSYPTTTNSTEITITVGVAVITVAQGFDQLTLKQILGVVKEQC